MRIKMTATTKENKPKAKKGLDYYSHVFARFGVWARKVDLSRKLSYMLALAALISGVTTYFAFTLPEGPDTQLVLLLLYLDLALLLCLVILLIRGLLKVWYEKRQGSIGSGLHVRFVLLFLIITAMPTILVSAFSAFFFSVGLQAWFGDQVYNAVRESKNVAEAYFKEHTNSITADVYSVMYDIDTIKMNKSNIENILNSKLISKGVDEAIVFDVSGKIIAKAGYTFTLSSEVVPFTSLKQADSGEIVVIVSDNNDWVKALVRIPDSISYLYIGRMVDPAVISHIERATIAANNYETLEGQRSMIELTFTGIFIIVSLLLMVVAAWVGMIFASRISTPIVHLIDAADKVRTGDFSVRVEENGHKDELSILTRAFNRMMGELNELQAAQRKAAWADVARRIAHEIKNPLTPIQLAAERLKRKYEGQIKDNAEDFAICTDTIIRHVADIGRMVDEFSAFARMPAPVFKKTDIRNIIEQAVFLQKNAHPKINFTADIPNKEVYFSCDNQQISQVVTNILKNAVEAIMDKDEKKGRIDIHLNQTTKGDITLQVIDNGKGLPKGDAKDKITEPYVTTKVKGTGLGLAIVKKIIEDHKGTLTIEDGVKGGAIVTITFPYEGKSK